MKFITATFFALVAVASASTLGTRPMANGYVVKRQTIQDQVDASIPAMSNQQGQVVPFNTANVYLDAKNKGI
ncbi:hypothetical protein B0H66DRAFT_601112 [Apodospora peruviana]|uniref:Uncharacterized protein n=1 Tax=Apodospora peruviana TaxID=516989 RepID=A0AAE0IAK5_9PEZI|nr:hypothetical protein B0H66DRAFT_601112 [Apodospora peruviana]